MIQRLTCFALLVLWVGCAAAQANRAAAPQPPREASLPEPSASARDLFSRTKDRIVQVRVLLASASEQSSLGSGFLVRDDGAQGAWVLTNYHVISALAIHPDKYRIELRGTNERKVRAQLMAVDVIHDLAVLRTDPPPAGAPGVPWNVFALRDTALVQGSKVFAMGNPLELGFVISEGIYNGPVESRIYEQMLFSGSLNSGMSGGPAID
ncbi:MAG TPA: serine protease, partial [Burkholderiaceae bacterium]|nr:serine protease [Burkholderiaceae bacterium]